MEKIRVLVVDDSKVSRIMMASVLSRTTFQICDYAKNSMEAVEKYRSLNPDVVTMDMNLPDGDGIECSRKILEINPQAKIVMISAMKDASLMMRGRNVGINSFLQKPINANELIDTLLMVCQSTENSIDVLRESYVKPFIKVLQKNLFSLAGLHSKVDLELDKDDFLDVNGIAVIIGLTGVPMGRAILHMDTQTMNRYSKIMLGMSEEEDLSEEEASDSVEESANIIVGRSVSMINDICKDKEMRITPPGTICGHKIRIVNPKLTAFNITASTRLGDFKMNIGFAEGE